MECSDYMLAIFTAIQYHEAMSTLNELSPKYQKLVKDIVKMLDETEKESTYEQSL